MSKNPDKKGAAAGGGAKGAAAGGKKGDPKNKNAGGEGEAEDEAEPEPGCCDKFAACIIVVCKVLQKKKKNWIC